MTPLTDPRDAPSYGEHMHWDMLVYAPTGTEHTPRSTSHPKRLEPTAPRNLS